MTTAYAPSSHFIPNVSKDDQEDILTEICVTCLSRKRELYEVKLTKQLQNICIGVTLLDSDHICWECKAQLRKMVQFRSRAQKAREILCHLAQTHALNNNGYPLSTLSTLHIKHLSMINIQHNDAEIQCKEEEDETQNEGDGNIVYDSDNQTEDVFAEPLATTIKVEPTLEINENTESKLEKSDSDDSTKPLGLLKEIKVASKRKKVNKKTNKRKKLPDTKVEKLNSNSSTESAASKHKYRNDENEYIKLRIISETELEEQRMKERDGAKFQVSLYKCEKCVQTFKNRDIFDKHLPLHSDKQGQFCCKVCEQRFPYESELTLHTQSHYRTYECVQCGKHSPRRQVALEHWKRKHDDTQRPCKHCGELLNPGQMKRHIYNAHGNHLKCQHCWMTFKTEDTLQKHVASRHAEQPLMECNVCHKQYKGEQKLRAHMRIHAQTTTENAYCIECGVQYKNEKLYKVHLATSSKHVPTEKLTFECSECHKKFRSKAYVKMHIEIMHLRASNYACDQCDKTFHAAISLRTHKRERHATKKRNVVCDVCGKAFTSKHGMAQHRNTHYGARPYECEVCGSTFSYSAALYTHNRLVHLKIKRPKRNQAS